MNKHTPSEYLLKHPDAVPFKDINGDVYLVLHKTTNTALWSQDRELIDQTYADPDETAEVTMTVHPEVGQPVETEVETTATSDTGKVSEIVSQSAVTFKDRASLLARLDIPVIPLGAKTKIAFLKEWEEKATTSPEQIERWSHEYHDANTAAVAYAKPGGTCFFEIDSPAVVERIKAETGREMPKTFRVRSRPGRGHFYFRHSTASLAAGNISQNFVKFNDWSLRADRQYVVGPLSYHPVSGGIYEVLSNAPIIPIPDWLIEWCVSQKQEAKKISPSIEGGKIPRGAHDTELTRIAGKLRNAGMEENSLTDTLIEICEKRCEDYGGDYREMCEKIAHSICRYPVPPANPVLIGGVPAGTATANRPESAIVSDPAQVAEMLQDAKIKEAEFVIENLDTSEQATRPVWPEWVMEGTSIYEGLVKPTVERSSKHAEFIFMPAFQAELNYLSGKVRLEFQNVHLNIFLGMVSPYGKFFKSSSCELSHGFMKAAGIVGRYTPSTRNCEAKVMISQAGSPEGFGISMSRINAKNAILYYDELGKFAAKAGIEGSSFASDLLTLYESGDFSNNITSQKSSFGFEPGSYCFGWTFCTTDRGFNRHWPKIAGISSGLEDRMFFMVSPKEPRPLVIETTFDYHPAAAKTRELIDKAVNQGIYSYEDFHSVQEMLKNVSESRAMGLCQKLALGFAVELGRPVVDLDCMERAVALVKYRDQAAAFLAPIEADNEQGRLQKEMIRELQRNSGKMSYREFCRKLDYTRYGIDKWKAAYRGMINEKILFEFDQPSSKGGRDIRMVGISKQDE